MATESSIRSWLAKYKRDFNQLCQALMWQVCDKFGSAPVVYASAKAAYKASKIVSKKAADAPAGSFHYWDIGSFGHVALGLGGERVLMGSTHITERWGINAGVTTVTAYGRATGARYLGWANTNGRNDVSVKPASSSKVRKIATWLNSQRLGRTTTAASDGIPGTNYWWLVQTWGAENGHYPAPAFKVDGKPGTRTYAVEALLWAVVSAPPVVADPAPDPSVAPVAEAPVEPEDPPIPPEPAPDPEPIPDQPKEEPMPSKPTVKLPDLPEDVIVPIWLRTKIYLTAFIVGILLDATVVGWVASGQAVPSWLFVVVAVYGSLSKSWAILARANANPVKPA